MKWGNKMKKKIPALILVTILLLSLLAACGNGDAEPEAIPEITPAIEETYPTNEPADENDEEAIPEDEPTDENGIEDVDDIGTDTHVNIANLSGTFILEDDPVFSITFSGNSFSVPLSHANMGLPELGGYFLFRGTFIINESTRTISLLFDEEVMLEDMVEMVWALLEMDPDMQEFLDDPDMEDMLVIIVDAMMGYMADAVIDEVMEELSGIELRYEDSFDRLYTDDGDVFIRQ